MGIQTWRRRDVHASSSCRLSFMAFSRTSPQKAIHTAIHVTLDYRNLILKQKGTAVEIHNTKADSYPVGAQRDSHI